MAAERPILLFLHPFPMDGSFWGPVWRDLAAEATALTPEFPGFGASPPSPDPTIAGFAADAAELVRAQDAGPATVVGLSMGGYVALALAAEHPDVVGALVLANTRAEADDEEGRRARDAAVDAIRVDGLPAFVEGVLPRVLGPEAPAATWERAGAIAGRQDPDSVCSALEAMRDRPDRRSDLAAIAVPTVVVTGADDTLFPRESSETLVDGIAGATLEVVPGAGHLSALERPAEFAGIVAALLGRPR